MIYFLGKKFLGDDLFVYQQTIDALELKKNNGTDYVLSWKSKGEILLNFNHCILFACKA